MRYATFRKDFFVTHKAKFLIKTQCVRLRVQIDLPEVHLPGLLDQSGQHCRTHALSTVFRYDRESRNLTGRFNSSGANCVTFFGECKDMRTILILAVPLLGLGNFLFNNENLATDE